MANAAKTKLYEDKQALVLIKNEFLEHVSNEISARVSLHLYFTLSLLMPPCLKPSSSPLSPGLHHTLSTSQIKFENLIENPSATSQNVLRTQKRLRAPSGVSFHSLEKFCFVFHSQTELVTNYYVLWL